MTRREALRIGLLWSGILIGLMLLTSAITWPQVPGDRLIPIHWGPDWQPDNFAHKTMALLIGPLVGLGITLLLALFSFIEPRQEHIKRSMKAYLAVWIGCLVLFTLLNGIEAAAALGLRVNVGVIVPLAIGLLFIVIGNYMGKVRSNFIFGIRTPWTLSSEFSWERTHRLGGKLFMLVGALTMMGVLFTDGMLHFVLLMAELIVFTVMLSIYSYLMWKADPARPGNEQAQPPNTRAITIIIVALMLGIALLASVAKVIAVPSADIKTRAREMIEAEASGNFAAAELNFDTQMLKAIPPAQLQQLWDGLEQKYGAYQSASYMQTVGYWPYTQVFMDVRFARATVTMKVVFDRQGQITGLWITGVR